MDIPFPLKQALENGSCVLFIGAGMGYHMLDPEGNTIPDATRLAKMLAEKFDVPTSGDYDLAKISQYVEVKKKGRQELVAFIQGCLAQATPDKYMMWIPSIKWRAILQLTMIIQSKRPLIYTNHLSRIM